jgi:hypothetical protein
MMASNFFYHKSYYINYITHRIFNTDSVNFHKHFFLNYFSLLRTKFKILVYEFLLSLPYLWSILLIWFVLLSVHITHPLFNQKPIPKLFILLTYIPLKDS